MRRRKSYMEEADLSKVRTVPIAERMQGWSAGAGEHVGKPNPTPPPRAHMRGWDALSRQEHYMLTGEDPD